jgi:hypothetical protein
MTRFIKSDSKSCGLSLGYFFYWRFEENSTFILRVEGIPESLKMRELGYYETSEKITQWDIVTSQKTRILNKLLWRPQISYN